MYTGLYQQPGMQKIPRSTMAARVLVVEDEPTVSEVVERYLRREGYEVAVASDGLEGLRLAQEWAPELVVLDLMLPQVDGLEVCRRLRRESQVPIIMLTARGEETDRVVGLEMGADDYMVKPFSPRELVARIKSVLRRASPGPVQAPGGTLRFENLTINPLTRGVIAGGKDVRLTAKEFDLLVFFASNPGQVFARDQLMDRVWDYTYAADSSTVTVHIRRLREKIEADPMRPRYIKTVWGVGYKFESRTTEQDRLGDGVGGGNPWRPDGAGFDFHEGFIGSAQGRPDGDGWIPADVRRDERAGWNGSSTLGVAPVGQVVTSQTRVTVRADGRFSPGQCGFHRVPDVPVAP